MKLRGFGLSVEEYERLLIIFWEITIMVFIFE